MGVALKKNTHTQKKNPPEWEIPGAGGGFKNLNQSLRGRSVLEPGHTVHEVHELLKLKLPQLCAHTKLPGKEVPFRVQF